MSTARQRDHDAVMERRFDWALREATGGERAPDVTEVVLARAAAGEVVDIGGRGAIGASLPRRLLVAALVLLGLGVVTALLVLENGTAGGGANQDAPLAPAPEQVEPGWVEVTTHEVIATLPPDTTHVAMRNLDDAAVAAVAARLPNLQGLRITASTAFRRQDDRRPPVSITDAAFASIAKLRELRQLELIGTDEVEGSGLARLDELPLLADLGLTFFDTPDKALEVLPRLPSLRSLVLTCNHGFCEGGIASIANCPGLQKLSLEACSQLHATWIAELGRLSRLRELNLGLIGSRWRGVATPDLAERGREKLDRIKTRADKIGAGLTLEGVAGWPELRLLSLSSSERLETGIGERLRTTCPKLRAVNLTGCPNVNDIDVAELMALRYLSRLDISRCPKTSRFSAPLLALATQLRDVGLEHNRWVTLDIVETLILRGKRLECRLGTGVNDVGMTAEAFNAGFAELSRRYSHLLSHPAYEFVRRVDDVAELSPDARWVAVEGKFAMTSEAFRRLSRLDTLEVLRIGQVDGVSAQGLGQLKSLPALRSLAVDGVDSNDSESMQSMLTPLPGFSALEELRLVGLTQLGERNLEAVLGCSGLRTLEVNSTSLTSESIARLGGVTTLETLQLISAGSLDDSALAGLRTLTGLRELALWRGRLTSRGLEALAGMTRLRSLMLNENPTLTTQGLMHVPVSIEELGLDGCRGLGADTGRLIRDRFPGLRKLYVSDNQWVDDDALGTLLQLPRLEVLEVRGCNDLTDAALPAIVAAKSLRTLNVWNCTWATVDVIEELHTLRPDLAIQVERR